MSTRIWPYVEDKFLYKEIELVLSRFGKEMDEANLHKNVVDPFSAIFDMAKQGISYSEWLEQEKSRQTQKTLQNLVGYFHQHLLGKVRDWDDMGAGGSFDLINNKKKIIVEIKNKHNTLNSNSATQTYNKMTAHLNGSYKGYQGYVVLLIPKSQKRYDKYFAPNDDQKPVNKRGDLKEIDGSTLYEIVTGDKDALKKLYACLPRAISIAMPGVNFSKEDEKKLKSLFDKAFG